MKRISLAISAIALAYATSAYGQKYELVDSRGVVVGEIIDPIPIAGSVQVRISVTVGTALESVVVSFAPNGITTRVNAAYGEVFFPKSNCTGIPHLVLSPTNPLPLYFDSLGVASAQFATTQRYPTNKGLWVQTGAAVTQIFPSKTSGNSCLTGLTATRTGIPLGRYVNVEAAYPPPYRARKK